MNFNYSMPKWGEDDLAPRMLVEPAYKEGKFVIDLSESKFDRERIAGKLRELTTGNFFWSGQWIQFEDEKDYVIFRLAV